MDRFFLLPGVDAPSLLPYGTYDPMLVVLSVCLAIFASTMALHATEQARVLTQSRLRSVTLLAGSLALGCGVWGMHFIGMLAYQLCTTVTYDSDLTTASVLPSVAASWVALKLLSNEHVSTRERVIAGVLVGAGIGAMHYTGMAAMQMSAALRYDPWGFALSIVVAVALAVLALWVRHGLAVRLPRYDGWRLTWAAGGVMGMAISGMHYTGMAAARFVGTATLSVNTSTPNSIPLSLGITLVTVVASVLVGAAVGLARYRQLLARMESKEERLRAITDTSMDAIIVFDEQGTVHKFNPAAERIFGVPVGEIMGHSVTRIMVEPYKSMAIDSFDRFLDEVSRAMGIELESHCYRADGRRVPIRLMMGRMASLQERLYVAFVSDISERKHMEMELRDREAQFRSLISNIPGISYRCRMEPGWPMVYISDAAERITGWPTAAFMGSPPEVSFASLVSPEDVKRIGIIVKQAADAETPFVLEFQLRTKRGELRWIWGNGSIARAADNSVKWIDGVLLDITERRMMEEELVRAKEKAEAAAQARTNFLANMSHEIRTPMNAILGFTDFVLDGELQATQRKHLETVRKSARSLLHLLNDILDSSKLDRGALELESLPFSLPELVGQLCAEQSIQASRKSLRLHGQVPPEVGDTVVGDPHRLRQILLNLLGNAIKFTEAGEVALSCARDGDRVHFQVRDTGIGIAPDRLASIFEAFTQADASMSRRFGGTGLGTTIAKQLTELMGGRIWVESTPGVGSTFHVELPLPMGQAPDHAGASAPSGSRGAVRLPPLRMLVVDDVPQNTELLCLVMGRDGHQVTTAHDGQQALALFTEQAFDIVLMDVQMPVMDGLSASRAIRELEARLGGRRTPIIALSASVLDEDRHAAQASGMDGFATKPLEIDALCHEIARVTGCGSTSQATTSMDTAPGATPGAAQAGLAIDTAGDLLDPDAGVRRWGDIESWQTALFRFAQQAGTLSGGDDPALQRAEAHRIKGVAGNLGLPHLSAAAARLEALPANAPTDELADAWSALSQALLSTVNHVAALRAQASSEPAAPDDSTSAPETLDKALDEVSLQALQADARTLQQAFSRGECLDELLETLCERARAAPNPTLLQAARQAADDFDFEAAARELGAWLDALTPQEA
ncbi:MHYT domain-containing protein [Aquabacterium sp. UBA2148]|uniref:MHYT domain-containing protein n=1 Tax=Aquabacterium sp. UBA2148 TaxID=1946042 RepID=UPI00257C2F0E|nr:MHYT domain-containing protein [Aquabacterium sp. UBA2148]